MNGNSTETYFKMDEKYEIEEEKYVCENKHFHQQKEEENHVKFSIELDLMTENSTIDLDDDKLKIIFTYIEGNIVSFIDLFEIITNCIIDIDY